MPRRAVGPHGRIPSSSTTTSSIQGGTLPPGNSPSSWWKSCAQVSDSCVYSGTEAVLMPSTYTWSLSPAQRRAVHRRKGFQLYSQVCQTDGKTWSKGDGGG